MPAPRFYCPCDLHSGQQLALPETAAHHASRVLRLQPGDAVTLFNGAGGQFPASIRAIDRHGVIVLIGEWQAIECESPLAITLAQALSTGEKMDFTLQKAVELGVTEIQPLASSRSVVKLSGERAQKRVEHWQNIVIAACEQCGRNRVPLVRPVMPLLTWLSENQGPGLRLMMSPTAATSLRDLPRPDGPITLLAGPEGGLTDAEIAAAQACGFTSVCLGARILRTETAALAGLSAIQTLWGDF